MAQGRHVTVHLLIGHFRIALRGTDVPVPHGLADRLDGHSLREADLGSKTVPGLMESDRLRKEKQTEED